jgi:DNA mismatch repair protein MutL
MCYDNPMPIAKLPPLLVNQIAAGEVIERPASVVKELVENSLDAGATRVDIHIEDGGRQLIRISDDGGGIGENELHLAVAPHATSKLDSSRGLEAIGTFGFRGEALASIASVSRLRISSRPRDAQAAAMIEAAGDDLRDIAPAAGAPGTIIEVRDLFFNTPARRKFMRAASTEFGHISEVVSRIAMANPDVAFSLIHGSRKTLDLPAQTQRQRCVSLLGKELDDALLEFEHEEDGASVWGLAGLPTIARATAKFQYLCLNGRPIRDRGLSHAIREAYRGLVPPDRHALAVVFVQIDPHAVDVNVHPAKAEVRFRDAGRLHGLVLHALRQRLLAGDLTPSAQVREHPKFAFGSTTSDEPDAKPQAAMNADAFVDYFKQMAPMQKGFVYEQVKAAMDDEPSPEPRLSAWEQAEQNAQQPAPALRDQGVLQVHKSYLVTQDDSGIIIIDQHALHERVMFEELRHRVLGKNLESQRLLMPATVKADAGRQALLDDLKPLLDQIGIEAEPIGPDVIAVHAFPTLLFEKRVDPAEFVAELLDKAADGAFDTTGPTSSEAALHEALDMMSCKAAVKAGDHLTPEELADLLKRREAIERSSNCPHGRPTTIRLSLRDLERQFMRT